MAVVVYLVLISFVRASADLHSLKYFYMAVSGNIDFPEFTAVGLVDDEQFMYFDSNVMRAVPKTEWITQGVGAEYWEQETQADVITHRTYKNNIQILIERFNQSKLYGVHTLQRMYGCEWDAKTGEVNGFDQIGYDGGDFIALDLKSMRYIAAVQQALITKLKWEADRDQLQRYREYFNKECSDWLRRYVQDGRSILDRAVSPEVSLLQRDSSSPVVCHVTGFYPRQVMISWQKNGQDLSEDVDLRETVPNGDGTFQKNSVLYMRPEDWRNNPETYSCVVQHRSLTEDIVIQLKPENVKSSSVSFIRLSLPVEYVAPVLILITVAVGFLSWRDSSTGVAVCRIVILCTVTNTVIVIMLIVKVTSGS